MKLLCHIIPNETYLITHVEVYMITRTLLQLRLCSIVKLYVQNELLELKEPSL